MASIITGSIKVDELKKIDQTKIIEGKKGNYIPITIKVNDESRYGNNVQIYIQQSPEEREAKLDRHFIGSASVVWTDNKIVKGEKDGDNNTAKQGGGMSNPFPTISTPPANSGVIDDLPF